MKYLKILYIQVLIGITLGVLAGWLFPGFAGIAKSIADTFINLIRMIIAPVIFCSIVIGIAGAGDMKKVGRLGIKALVYFEIVSSAALVSSSGILRPMPAAPKVPPESQKTARALSLAYNAVAEFVRPSVVQISVQKKGAIIVPDTVVMPKGGRQHFSGVQAPN